MQAHEARIAQLERGLVRPDAPLGELDDKGIERALAERTAQFRELLHDNMPKAGQVLRTLLDGLILLEPVVEDGRKGYRFAGRTRIGPLVSGGIVTMASPRGFEPLLPA